jgi:ADP-glucose pyrophosphorylase
MNKRKIISHREFTFKLLKYFYFLVIIILMSLTIGVMGYRYFADLTWIDSFYNASMILTGMGPANPMPNNSAKIFSSIYAVFSGVTFLTTIAIFVTPIVHRLMTLLHIDDIE